MIFSNNPALEIAPQITASYQPKNYCAFLVAILKNTSVTNFLEEKMKKISSLLLMAAINMQDFAFINEIPLGPQTKIRYHSRSVQDHNIGIGWILIDKSPSTKIIKDPITGYVESMQTESKIWNFSYRNNHLVKLKSGNFATEFEYDEFSNLIEIKRQSNPLFQISYDSDTDTALIVRDRFGQVLWQRQSQLKD
jgi:YD repeat-containing protein